jgi:hypothetical protein
VTNFQVRAPTHHQHEANWEIPDKDSNLIREIKMTDSNLSEASARRAERAARLGRAQVATAAVAPEHDAAHQGVPSETVEEQVNISSNPIHVIMEDGSLSNDEKIEKIAAYLTAEQNDYPEARRRFAEFEAYYAHTQSENMKIDVKGIERLIEELRNSLKPEVEKIARDLSDVQIKVQDAKKKLEVLREARKQGKSLEELTAAFRENESLLTQIAETQKTLDQLARSEVSLRSDLATAEERKKESQSGFLNSLARAFVGPDKDIAATIQSIETRLRHEAEEMTRTTEQKHAIEANRDQKLEIGPLLILRAVDATEKGYSDDLIQAAESGLSLVNGAAQAVGRLIHRNAFSVEQARVINMAISRSAVSELVIKKAIELVTEKTHDQGSQLEQQLTANAASIKETAASGESTTELEVQKLDLDQKHRGATEYVDILGRTSMQFDKAAANSTGAQAQAEQLAELLQQEKEVLIGMASEALPTTTRALRLTLNQALALHAHELGSTVHELIQRAQELNSDSMKQLVDTQSDLHKQEIAKIEEAMRALDESAELMTKQVEANVEAAAERMQKMAELRDAAEGLNQARDALSATRPGVVHSNSTAEVPPPPAG